MQFIENSLLYRVTVDGTKTYILAGGLQNLLADLERNGLSDQITEIKLLAENIQVTKFFAVDHETILCSGKLKAGAVVENDLAAYKMWLDSGDRVSLTRRTNFLKGIDRTIVLSAFDVAQDLITEPQTTVAQFVQKVNLCILGEILVVEKLILKQLYGAIKIIKA